MTTISHNKLYVNKSELIYKPLCFHKKNLMQTATGYGLKLKTEYMYRYKGNTYRVLYANFSNSGTFYIRTKEQDIILDINWED